jgi:5-methylcytosine-specific restriction protein B
MIKDRYKEFITRSTEHPDTVEIYLKGIDSLANKIGQDPYNLAIDELETLYSRLLSVGDLHEYNISVNNRAPSAALKKLITLLKNGDESPTLAPKSYWFVGASYGDTSEDQTDRFIEEGIWQNGFQDKLLDTVRSMQPGDRIAIKSAYTRKHGLPFDNKDQTVSVMGIKAIGVVTRNHDDGRFVDVDWGPRFEPVREWYFYTNRSTIWRLSPGEWMIDGLIDFTFNHADQDINRFRNEPYWRERYGDTPLEKQRFKWTAFYLAIADRLLTFKNKRAELINFITKLADDFDLSYIKGKQLDDIDPFTTMGLFNRGITDDNRKAIAASLAGFLGVEEAVPVSFEGIPILNNQKSWFFGFEDKRQDSDIESLWTFFEKAILFADTDDADVRAEFNHAYDLVAAQYSVGWNLTMGLYWIRPWNYVTLDSQSQQYINQKLGIEIIKNGPKGRCSAKDYLEILDDLEVRFKEEAYPVHSFPDLSYVAWLAPPLDDSPNTSGWRASVIEKIIELCTEKGDTTFTRTEFLEANREDLQNEFPNNNTVDSTVDRTFQKLRDDDLLEFVNRGQYCWLNEAAPEIAEAELLHRSPEPIYEPYTLDDIIADGSFIDKPRLAQMIERLRIKKNLIIQGPPGTGKTWLAKKLAFALMGHKNDNNIRALQFHPNLSYEDFVRGWRPSGDGKLSLVDGPFMEAINKAKGNANSKYVVVIEEINRGNPAQIFGEMLTLLEADKRTPTEALELSYRRNDTERVFVPDNLYVIGTMNIADRSLALVDLALRRRFAFIDLKPTFGKPWREWVHSKAGIALELLEQIEQRLIDLNTQIEDDRNLGAQFKVGHSYVTPAFSTTIDDAHDWFKQVVYTEIGPLLDEYWFDDLDRSRKAQDALIAGM